MGAHQPHGSHSTHNPQPGQDHGVPKKKRKQKAHPSKRWRQLRLGGEHTPPRGGGNALWGWVLGGSTPLQEVEAMHLGGEHTPPRGGGNALHCSTVHARAHLRQSSSMPPSPPPRSPLHDPLRNTFLCAASPLSAPCPQASPRSPEPQPTGAPTRRELDLHFWTF